MVVRRETSQPRFLRATLDALDANIAVLDEAGTIVAVNAGWEGFARDNGMPRGWTGIGANYLAVCDDASGPDSREAEAAAAGIRAVLGLERDRFLIEYPCHGPDEERWFSMRATRFEAEGPRVVVAHENVTGRTKAERALRRAERLASIGTLAGGMAHEINNPIGALLLAARSAQSHLGDRERIASLLEQIVSSAQRCSGIVQSLVRCVRGGKGEPAPRDLNPIVRQAAELLSPWAEQHGVELRIDLAELPAVPVVEDDVRLAVYNLGANAIQSCEPGGCVSIETRSAGDRVRLAVEDDGRGMTEEEQAHAFDPFFSRHTTEVATGLGLTLCHGIANDHGGEIEVHSSRGQGTRVVLDLPVR